MDVDGHRDALLALLDSVSLESVFAVALANRPVPIAAEFEVENAVWGVEEGGATTTD